MMFYIKELSGFLRLKLCIMASFLAMFGYLLFNEISVNILYVLLASFCLTASGYAYNIVKDKKEDLINRGRLNYFSSAKSGIFIIIFFAAAGMFFSSFLSYEAPLSALAFLILVFLYSILRLKKYFLVKNIYTGYGIGILFLMGASKINFNILQSYFILSLFFMTGSIISDLRDYRGDKTSKLRTLPVMLGYNKTKSIIYILLLITPFFILFTQNRLYFILIFYPLIWLGMIKNRPFLSHLYGGLSVIAATFLLIIF